MVKSDTGPDLAGAVAAMRQAPARGHGRKGAVYVWLAAHHDALGELFKRETPSWTALAKYLGKGGVMGTDGLPPTAASVRSTWLRVVENTERRRARSSVKPALSEERTTDPPGADPLPDNLTFTPIRGKP